MSEAIGFSIVILTRNSLGVIERLVQSLEGQNFSTDREYLFMDNHSTDGTRDYLESLPLKNKRVIDVPEGSFSHSGTRMHAAREARGKFIIFFTDDIEPASDDFLLNLTEPVVAGNASAAYGVCQIHPQWHDPLDAYLHNDWYLGFSDYSEPVGTYCWEMFTPETRRRLANFDNCSSCLRLDLLLEMSFPDVPYGEDMMFAKQLLLSGHRVALAKKARFYHWHKVSFSYFLKRMCIDSHLGIREFGLFYVTRMLGVVRHIAVRVLHRTYVAFFKIRLPFFRKFYWSWYHARLLTADFLGKYMGTLDSQRANRGFSPLKRYLFNKKEQILDSIYKKSIHRY